VPKCNPSRRCPGVPVTVTLRRGTTLQRIHKDRYRGNQFNATAATSPNKGGRFDHTSPGEAFLYAGSTLAVAVAETILHDVPAQPTPRHVPFKKIEGRIISRLRLRRAIKLVSLRIEDLDELGQDEWLTGCEAADYPFTRKWAAAIRGWVPTAGGFVWQARQLKTRLAYVFYWPRANPRDFEVISTRKADEGSGLRSVRRVLKKHQAVVDRP